MGRDLPGEIRREVADVTDPAEAARVIGRIAGEAGPPDALVNTIGMFSPEDILATTPETLRSRSTSTWDRAVATEAVVRHTRQQGEASPFT